jgi:hypothetical protein
MVSCGVFRKGSAKKRLILITMYAVLFLPIVTATKSLKIRLKKKILKRGTHAIYTKKYFNVQYVEDNA